MSDGETRSVKVHEVEEGKSGPRKRDYVCTGGVDEAETRVLKGHEVEEAVKWLLE